MCGPVCMSYRSGKINSLYGYKYISICLLTANKFALFSFSFILYILIGAVF